jgi:cyclopropane-fatty-acyl-phospholipid synthase
MLSEPTSYCEPNEAAARPGASSARAAFLGALQGMVRGRMEIVMPEGPAVRFGSGAERLPLGIAPAARIRVGREAFFRKCLLYGDIGFAESYMDGDWSSPDLVAVVAWFILNIENAPTLTGSGGARGRALNVLRLANRLGHALRTGSRSGARRNIRDHYDLSNDFFALFLDPSMMYSAARWSRPSMTLEQAQAEKNELLCRQLGLTGNDHVLEIGSGWGGWAVHAARNHGCRVTTVTLSKRQHDYAVARVAREGLSGRVTVRHQDFREISGTYDKAVSIEMIEALGHRHLADFCRVVGGALKPDGLLAMQFITCPDSRYEELRRGVDFIQKHVFPGSLLLSLNRVNDLLSREAGMVIRGTLDMGPDYALTLRRWAEAFEERLREVRALGFDERFIRKWRYYLAYCEAAFGMRNISVVQTLHARPNNLSPGGNPW